MPQQERPACVGKFGLPGLEKEEEKEAAFVYHRLCQRQELQCTFLCTAVHGQLVSEMATLAQRDAKFAGRAIVIML